MEGVFAPEHFGADDVGAGSSGDVGEQVNVQVAVAVIVEKRSLGAVAGIGQAHFGRFVGEGAVAVVDVKCVGALGLFVGAGEAEIDVQPAIAVDVHHGDAGGPFALGVDAGLPGGVFELKVAAVEVEPGLGHIGGKEDIGEAVVVHVADADAGAVVEVFEGEDVERLVFPQLVGEGNAGFRRVSELEECIWIVVRLIAGLAAGEKE
ncbi:MAG: hypothetical protein RI973_712 [Bacteroidota bacterium]